MKDATLKQIATQLGVSITTVSKALKTILMLVKKTKKCGNWLSKK
jgi:LacI family transcriptional regulator